MLVRRYLSAIAAVLFDHFNIIAPACMISEIVFQQEIHYRIASVNWKIRYGTSFVPATHSKMLSLKSYLGGSSTGLAHG